MGDMNNPYETKHDQQDMNPDQSLNQQAQSGQDQNQQSQYNYSQPQYQQPQYEGQSNQQNEQNYSQYQQGYSQYQQPMQKKFNGLSLASLICGAISFLFGCCMWYIMWMPSIAGIVLGILSLNNNKNRGIVNKTDKIMSIIGIVLAAIALLTISIWFITSIFFKDTLMDIINNAETNYSY